MARLVQETNTVVSPNIAVIDKNNLQFLNPAPSVPAVARGNFNWVLSFDWEIIPEEERIKRKDETNPLRQIHTTLFSVTHQHIEGGVILLIMRRQSVRQSGRREHRNGL